jgi:hypothetical protein
MSVNWGNVSKVKSQGRGDRDYLASNARYQVLRDHDVKYSAKFSSLKAFNKWKEDYNAKHDTQINYLVEENDGDVVVYVDVNKDEVFDDGDRIIAINGARFTRSKGDIRKGFTGDRADGTFTGKKSEWKKAKRARLIEKGDIKQSVYEIAMVDIVKPVYDEIFTQKEQRKNYPLMTATRDVYNPVVEELLALFFEQHEGFDEEDEKTVKKVKKLPAFKNELLKRLWSLQQTGEIVQMLEKDYRPRGGQSAPPPPSPIVTRSKSQAQANAPAKGGKKREEMDELDIE